MSMTVYECWVAADGDREKYQQLLRMHGHLVPRKPGEDGNLPCGWPGNAQPAQALVAPAADEPTQAGRSEIRDDAQAKHDT